MSRWRFEREDIFDDALVMSCPQCESTTRISNRVWANVRPYNDLGPKPTYECRTCRYKPHLPGPLNFEQDMRKARGCGEEDK